MAGWQRSLIRLPRIRIQNGPPFIKDRSSPGGGSREGVFHKCSDIYTSRPKTAPYQGIINRYLPSWETPQRWNVRPCPSDPRLWVGGCCVVSWTCTLRHGDSNTPLKATFYITCGTSSTCAAPQKKTVMSQYVFGWCLCQDKLYGTIILTTISFRAYRDNYKLWIFLSFNIWTQTKMLYKHQRMFMIFGSFDIVTIIFFCAFCMLYHVWLCSCHPCNITQFFPIYHQWSN